jgi:hypothetical protein
VLRAAASAYRPFPPVVLSQLYSRYESEIKSADESTTVDDEDEALSSDEDSDGGDEESKM